MTSMLCPAHARILATTCIGIGLLLRCQSRPDAICSPEYSSCNIFAATCAVTVCIHSRGLCHFPAEESIGLRAAALVLSPCAHRPQAGALSLKASMCLPLCSCSVLIHRVLSVHYSHIGDPALAAAGCFSFSLPPCVDRTFHAVGWEATAAWLHTARYIVLPPVYYHISSCGS